MKLKHFSLRPLIVMITTATLLSACGGESGSESTFKKATQLNLEQCQVESGRVLGTPMDRVNVNGTYLRACKIDVVALNQAPTNPDRPNQDRLKSEHLFEPLVWVLDDVLEVGSNKQYESLSELQSEPVITVDFGMADNFVFATQKARIVVHRNGSFRGSVSSLEETAIQTNPGLMVDGDLTRSINSTLDAASQGEWGGLIVNGYGYHEDCNEETFCNLKTEEGYYFGGLSQVQQSEYLSGEKALPLTTRIDVAISEAGVNLESSPSAAVVLNAPLLAKSLLNSGAYFSSIEEDNVYKTVDLNVFYSGKDAIHWNGGAMNLQGYALGNTGSLVKWDKAATGNFGKFTVHRMGGDLTKPAIFAENGDVAINQVAILDKTYIDSLEGEGTLLDVGAKATTDVKNLLAQGFNRCVKASENAKLTLSAVAWKCNAISDESDDVALKAIKNAKDDAEKHYYEVRPQFGENMALLNKAELPFWGQDSLVGNHDEGTSVLRVNGYSFSLTNDASDSDNTALFDCLGVGTLLPESDTFTSLNGNNYRLCAFNPLVAKNVELATSAVIPQENGNLALTNIAWLIRGDVQVGQKFPDLNSETTLAALKSPQRLVVPKGVVLVADNNSQLTIEAGTELILPGGSPKKGDRNEFAIPMYKDGQTWNGLVIKGFATEDCLINSEELPAYCTYANQSWVEADGLVLSHGRKGSALLTLENVGAGQDFSYLTFEQTEGRALHLKGGEANLDHLLMDTVSQQHIFWEEGFRGTVRFVLSKVDTEREYSVIHGINNPFTPEQNPFSAPIIANTSLISTVAFEAPAIQLAFGTGAKILHSAVTGFSRCLDIDHPETAALIGNESADLILNNVLLDCGAQGTLAADQEIEAEVEITTVDDFGFETTEMVTQLVDYGFELLPKTEEEQAERKVYFGESAQAFLDEHNIISNAGLVFDTQLNRALAGNKIAFLLASGEETNKAGAVFEPNSDWLTDTAFGPLVLSPECNNLGTLIEDHNYIFMTRTFSSVPYRQVERNGENVWVSAQDYYDNEGNNSNKASAYFAFDQKDAGFNFNKGYGQKYKLCSLRGTQLDSKTLVRYTGQDATYELNENGEYQQPVQIEWEGEVYDVSIPLQPRPTIWVLEGMVQVGEGNKTLTAEEANELKNNPVSLTIEQGAIVMASTESSGLHVTRGGKLEALGEAIQLDDACQFNGLHARTFNPCEILPEAGPITFTGRFSSSQLIPQEWRTFNNETGIAGPNSNAVPFASIAFDDVQILPAKPWQGIIVDGFGLHNQCDVLVGELDQQACNIQGVSSVYGGYDADHNNLKMQNVFMVNGLLQLNAVGRGSHIIGLTKYLSADDPFAFPPPSPISSNQQVLAEITLDGGSVTLKNLMLGLGSVGVNSFQVEQPKLRWNHGYNGVIQHAIFAQFETDTMLLSGNEHPVLQGWNVSEGEQEIYPVTSSPIILNTEITSERGDFISGSHLLMDISQGSGIRLFNSILSSSGFSGLAESCIKFDEHTRALKNSNLLQFQGLVTACRRIGQSDDDENLFSTVLGESEILINDFIPANSNSIAGKSAVHNWYSIMENAHSFTSAGIIPINLPDGTSIMAAGWLSFGSDSFPMLSSFIINTGVVDVDLPVDVHQNPDVDEAKYFGSLDYIRMINLGAEIL